jgi:predicted Fe-Mo cluster-binding NifX family protein
MKIAVSAQGNDIAALVDPRFGRARWLVIADPESGDWTALDNSAAACSGGGSGIRAIGAIAEQDVSAVITGNVGVRTFRALAADGVTVFQVGNGLTVRDALVALRRSELTPLTAPTIHGHWD